MSLSIVSGPHVAQFVADRLDARFAPPYSTLGIERDGEVVAGVVLNCFTGPDIEVSVAGDYFPRHFIRRVGDYVFIENNCLRMTITTEQEAVIDIAHRLGAQTEGRKRNHFGKGRDGTILGILREDWKF